MSPVDSRKAIVRAAYDSIADTWGRERERIEDARERVWLERFCAALPGTRVLDLGCGGGAILRRLAKRGLEVVGVDFSRAQLNRAAPARLVQADMSQLEFAAGSFDGTIVYDSLWHV